MPYVSRNENGEINGVYVNLQPGYGEEHLADDDPAVLAFMEKMTPAAAAPGHDEK